MRLNSTGFIWALSTQRRLNSLSSPIVLFPPRLYCVWASEQIDIFSRFVHVISVRVLTTRILWTLDSFVGDARKGELSLFSLKKKEECPNTHQLHRDAYIQIFADQGELKNSCFLDLARKNQSWLFDYVFFLLLCWVWELFALFPLEQCLSINLETLESFAMIK